MKNELNSFDLKIFLDNPKIFDREIEKEALNIKEIHTTENTLE